MTSEFTGIARAVEYSPHHESTDAAIMRLTREAIEARGFRVALVGEDDLPAATIDSPVVFHMCQGPRSLPWLREIEARGALFLNTPASVENCYRTFLTRRVAEASVSFPRTVVVSTALDEVPQEARTFANIWVKRGDVHATHPNDVVRVTTSQDALRVLAGMRERGIPEAILQEHVDGDVVKFYSIHQDGFFEWYHAEGVGTHPVDVAALSLEAERAAHAAGLSVYGGDIVVNGRGLTLIDLNDWPSFARFRDRAARSIAEHIIGEAQRHGRID